MKIFDSFPGNGHKQNMMGKTNQYVNLLMSNVFKPGIV